MQGARWKLPFLYSVEVCLRILRVGDTIRISRKGAATSASLSAEQHMKLTGYLDHIDLGIDSESGEKGILVRSAKEFFELPEDQQYQAWSVIKVASEILEKPAITIYQHAYSGKIPSKVIKKNPWDRHGLTVVKLYQSLKDRETQESRKPAADSNDPQEVFEASNLATLGSARFN